MSNIYEEIMMADRVRRYEEKQKFFSTCFQSHEPLGEDYKFNTRWLIDGFLPAEYFMLLAAPPKSGKSAFVTAMALAVMSGDDFAGMKVDRGSVLWITNEENRQERWQIFSLCDYFDKQELPLAFNTYELPPLDSDEGLEALEYGINQYRAKLVILDSLYSLTSANLTKNRSARKTMAGLKQIADGGRAIVALHHMSRHQHIADSVQLEAAASISAMMSHVPTDDGRIVSLKCRGRGGFANRDFHFFSRDPLHYELTDRRPPKEEPTAGSEQAVLACLSDGERTFGELKRLTGANRHTLRTAVRNLVEDGDIDYWLSDRHHRVYRLPHSDPQ